MEDKMKPISTISAPVNEPIRGNRTISQIMTRNIIMIGGDDLLSEAVKLMNERNIGCVIVLKDGFVEGIITETDLMKNVARGLKKNAKVRDVMSCPVMTAEGGMSVIEATELMRVHGFRRLPVVEGGKLVGIVTETDLAKALSSSTVWKKIQDNMSTDVLTASEKDTVVKVAELMTVKNVGCVVVKDSRQKVKGIVTEKDILKKILAKEKNPEKTVVSEIMTSPAVTVSPDLSIYTAMKLMEENGFRRLPVTDNGSLVGIVTQTDLANAMRFFILDVEPRMEAKLKSTPTKYSLSKGRSYLIEENDSQKSFEIFEDIVKHGSMGLCISRTNPKRIRGTYGLIETPIIWVTDINSEERCIHPNDLTGLSTMAAKFIRKAKDSIIFLEALTYLINYNDFNVVLRTVQHIRDTVSDSNSSFIISVDPSVLSQRELKLLVQEMDEIKFIL
jgi:CBS domain-containing protein